MRPVGVPMNDRKGRDEAVVKNACVQMAPGVGEKERNFRRRVERGNLGFPLFTTPMGRIGPPSGYDGWFPESYRLCALQGADIVCVPTNWVPIPGQAKDREAMANILVMAAAHANSVFVAAADRVGTERGQPFIGQSLIATYTAWPIAGPASPPRRDILYAEANP